MLGQRGAAAQAGLYVQVAGGSGVDGLNAGECVSVSGTQ